MNSEIISLIVAIVSFLLLVFFVFKKATDLKNVSESETIFLKKELKEKIKRRTKEVTKESSNFLESLLHKFLSKVRILSLKADNKLSSWIVKLRNRSQKNNIDGYWSEIKESINKKK